MLLQKALGTVGAYIVLFCVAAIALIFMAYGLFAGQNEGVFAIIRDKSMQIKEKLLSFIFIEEEDEEEEMSGSRKEKDRQGKKKSTEQREEKIIKKEKAAYATEQYESPPDCSAQQYAPWESPHIPRRCNGDTVPSFPRTLPVCPPQKSASQYRKQKY